MPTRTVCMSSKRWGPSQGFGMTPRAHDLAAVTRSAQGQGERTADQADANHTQATDHDVNKRPIVSRKRLLCAGNPTLTRNDSGRP